MASDKLSWKDEILSKLMEIYGPNSKTPNTTGLTRLLAFLDMTDFEMEKQSPDTITPFWRTLRTAYRLNANSMLKDYADRIMKDAEEYERNPNFLLALIRIYEGMADPNAEEFVETLTTFKDVAKLPLDQHKGSAMGMGMGVARVWDIMPLATKTEIVQVIKTIATNYRALSCVDECVSLVSKYGGTVVMVGLAAISVTWQCAVNLKRWWNGEISGRRCSKGCIDSIVEISGGLAGGLAGAALGSAIFPIVGTFIGGIVGGLAAGATAKLLSDRLTMLIFDLPRDEAVEKAYAFMGVHHKASNDVVNKAFRSKALTFHPDKGGNVEDFYQLQFQMGVIKLARGEQI